MSFDQISFDHEPLAKFEEKLVKVLEDDFNTPEAIAVIFDTYLNIF